MKLKYIKYLAFIISLVSMVSPAQTANYKNNLSVGMGNSLYNEIRTKQLLLFYNVPRLSEDFGNLSLNTDLNLELISHNNSTTIVAGFVPMFRYNLDLIFSKTFLSAGIGFNYLNNHNIGSRNLGGHFIFSDMISFGVKVIDSEYLTAEISYLFRHISNAGLFNDNESFNSQYLVISVII